MLQFSIADWVILFETFRFLKIFFRNDVFAKCINTFFKWIWARIYLEVLEFNSPFYFQKLKLYVL